MNKEQLEIIAALVDLLDITEDPIIEEVGEAFVVTLVSIDAVSDWNHIREETYTYVIHGVEFKQISKTVDGWKHS